MSQYLPPIEIQLPVTEPAVSAAPLLAAASGWSIGAIKRAMQSGAVWLTRDDKTARLRRQKRRLLIGDTLHAYLDESVLAQSVPPAQLIADQTDYSVWYKPYGMWSHGSRWADHCAITRSVEQQTQRPTFIVHRLDRATRGVMLVAHSKNAAAALSALFKERRVDKRYRAEVRGLVAPDRLPLEIREPLDDKPAHSTIICLRQGASDNNSVLEVQLHSGRKHQVRRHLAALGWPVIGDRLYGSATTGDADLQLESVSLSFDCPILRRPVGYEWVSSDQSVADA